jgi:hypothetical protein
MAATVASNTFRDRFLIVASMVYGMIALRRVQMAKIPVLPPFPTGHGSG